MHAPPPDRGLRRSMLLMWVEAFAVLCVAPNIGVFALADFDVSARAVVDLDYLVLGAFLPFLPVWPGLGLYLVAIAADVLSTLGTRYGYPPLEMLWLVPQLFTLDVGWYVVLGGALGSLLLLRVLHRGRRLSALLTLWSWTLPALCIALAAGGLDVFGGTTTFSAQTQWTVNVANAGSYAVLRQVRKTARPSHAPPEAAVSAAEAIVGEVQSDTTRSWRGSMVLIVVESWGRFVHGADDSVLVEPFARPAVTARYDVRFGDVPFVGSTSQGELRELCGLRMDFRAAIRSTPEALKGCLPWRLRERGYRAVSLHGFRESFYRRPAWYSKVGFQEMKFGEDPGFGGLNRCGGVFRGVCDEDMVSALAAELRRGASGTPRFLYLVTLTSHVPVSLGAAEGSRLDCGRIASARDDEEICTQARLLDGTLEAIARLATDATYPPAVYIVVGDHSPPFFGTQRRRLFDQHEVPFVALIPRSGARPGRHR